MLVIQVGIGESLIGWQAIEGRLLQILEISNTREDLWIKSADKDESVAVSDYFTDAGMSGTRLKLLEWAGPGSAAKIGIDGPLLWLRDEIVIGRPRLSMRYAENLPLGQLVQDVVGERIGRELVRSCDIFEDLAQYPLRRGTLPADIGLRILCAFGSLGIPVKVQDAANMVREAFQEAIREKIADELGLPWRNCPE
jgi:hypothetical protein